MKLGFKDFFLSIAEYATCLLIFWAVTIPIHEFAHLQVLRWLGGNGHIIITWYGAAVVFTKQPTNPFLTALAGGISVVAIYAILFFWDWVDGDYEEAVSLLPFIFSQFLYGLLEAFFIFSMPFGIFHKWASVVMTAGIVTGTLIGLYILWRVKWKEPFKIG